MTEHEKKDMYIAFAVGGVALVLILLYLYGGTNAASADTSAPSPADLTAAAPPDQTPYNYNVAPYNPAPPIQFGAVTPANNNQPGGACCDRCGPSVGNDIFSTSVAQYQTLIGMGGG